MSELTDFQYFQQHQLCNVDFVTGQIDVYGKTTGKTKRIYTNIGSLNQDGYERVWCKGKLRMKHRLLWFLFTGNLPDEIDHIDKNRSNNSIYNLRNVSRNINVKDTVQTNGRRKFSQTELHQICQYIQQGINDTQISYLMKCSRVAIMGIRHKRRHKDIADLYF